jgi:hypothetical protein
MKLAPGFSVMEKMIGARVTGERKSKSKLAIMYI